MLRALIMPADPTRSACFQPDSYRNLDLFADRHVLLGDFVETLKSYLDPEGPGEGRVLVRGDRGVGKSMLARRAIRDVTGSLEVLHAEVDCAQTVHGSEAVLRQLAAELAREALENSNDPTLRAEAEMLLRLSEVTKVRARDVKTWSTSLKLGTSVTYKLADKVQFEFGMTRVTGRSREVEESSERAIDVAFLERLIEAFLSDCKRQGTHVLVFVDNLDQAGFAEVQEDVRNVTDLARYLFKLPSCLVVATIRTEFVSSDLSKLHSCEVVVDGMDPDELCEVAAERMKSCGQRQRRALKDANFEAIAQMLSRWTDNAWGFLVWLAALDYESFTFLADQPDKLRDTLLPLMRRTHSELRAEELGAIGRIYVGDPNGFRTETELKEKGVDDDLRRRAVRCGALVPDWLLNPDRYMLSPRLHFLAASDSRAPGAAG